MHTRVIIAENIRSLHNVGAIFRTSDSAGWDHVCLCGYTGCPPDRRIEKVSLGAEDFVSWEHAPDTQQCIQKYKDQGFKIVALELTDSAADIFQYQYGSDEKIALILGNEIEGVTPESLSMADDHVLIPMLGKKASLNVSVACGVALYALRKKS